MRYTRFVTAVVLAFAALPASARAGEPLCGLGACDPDAAVAFQQRILPFVATLGTLTVFSGVAFLVSGGRTIFGRDIPPGFSGFARAGIDLNPFGDAAVMLP